MPAHGLGVGAFLFSKPGDFIKGPGVIATVGQALGHNIRGCLQQQHAFELKFRENVHLNDLVLIHADPQHEVAIKHQGLPLSPQPVNSSHQSQLIFINATHLS